MDIVHRLQQGTRVGTGGSTTTCTLSGTTTSG